MLSRARAEELLSSLDDSSDYRADIPQSSEKSRSYPMFDSLTWITKHDSPRCWIFKDADIQDANIQDVSIQDVISKMRIFKDDE